MRPIYFLANSPAESLILSMVDISYVLAKAPLSSLDSEDGALSIEDLHLTSKLQVEAMEELVGKAKRFLPNPGITLLSYSPQEELYNPRLVVGYTPRLVLDGEVLYSPKDAAKSRENLLRLSERGSAEVVTSIYIKDLDTQEAVTTTSRTGILYKRMTEAEIETYINTEEYLLSPIPITPFGKGSLLIKAVLGDMYGAGGFPLYSILDSCSGMTYRAANIWWN